MRHLPALLLVFAVAVCVAFVAWPLATVRVYAIVLGVELAVIAGLRAADALRRRRDWPRARVERRSR